MRAAIRDSSNACGPMLHLMRRFCFVLAEIQSYSRLGRRLRKNAAMAFESGSGSRSDYPVSDR